MIRKPATADELQTFNNALSDLRLEMARMENELDSIGETLTLIKSDPEQSVPAHTPTQKAKVLWGMFKR